MEPGDRLKIKIPKSQLNERLKEVAYIRQIIKSGTIMELEDKELEFVKDSSSSNKWAIVKTPNGNEHEVCKDFLEKIA